MIGIMRSSRMTSGRGASWRYCSASRPLATVSVWYPSSVSNCAIISRRSASSSTMSTGHGGDTGIQYNRSAFPVMRLARRYLVRGRVQGVGFRYYTHRAAVQAGVQGWVRNNPDGTVEIAAAGGTDAP